MNERVAAPVAGLGRSPGAMLREARLAQGMHIAALAAAMKVSQRKLEALEGDRLDELPDATFTRALAQSVCRTLKIDAAPVLALLPQHVPGKRLEHVSEGINEPFRDRPGRREPADFAVLRSPVAWVVYLILVASIAVYFLPQRLLSTWQFESMLGLRADSASAPASSAVAAASAPTGIVTETVAIALPSPTASPASSGEATPAAGAANAPASAATMPGAPADAASGVLLVRAKVTASWVEVRDSRALVLLSRTVAAGETVALDGVAPFRIKIGNAIATELVYQGRPVDVAAQTRDNIARFELK